MAGPRAQRRHGLLAQLITTSALSALLVGAGPAPALGAAGRGGGTGPGPSGTLPPDPPVPASTIVWSSCDGDLQCGTLSVPLNYADPSGAHISLAVIRHLAEVPAARLGSLVIDPGGPGDSGVDDLQAELAVLTPGLLERFDIVEFDPRGVDRSDPVSCSPPLGAAATTSGAITTTAPSDPGTGVVVDPVPTNPGAGAALLDADRAYAADCAEASGTLLRYVGTEDAARDLEVLRGALGDPKLTYLGHSYGTLLGAIYAQLYPQRVRAMVLDGAVDPSLSTLMLGEEQAQGFEQSLNSFFAWCRASASCPWHPPGSPLQALLTLVARAAVHPLPGADGSEAGPGDIYDGVLGDLYSPATWPSLAQMLAEAAQGNGTELVASGSSYVSHGGGNASEAHLAITCADDPVPTDPAAYPAAARAAAVSAPFFGPLLVWGELSCAVWPAPPSRDPGPVSDPGAPPVLVTGTTDDPATPYAWAVSLARQLHGVLLTRRGYQHVAYYYSSCVRAIDQQYLISGSLPPPGTVCD